MTVVQRNHVIAALLLLALAGTASGQSRRAWPDERRFGPFVFHADFPLRSVERHLRETARLQADMTRLLGLPPAREPIHVFLFHQRATYARYVRHYFPQAPDRKALFVKRRGPGMVFVFIDSQAGNNEASSSVRPHHDFATDLRHECTHALLHAVLPTVPLWLDEGLAEYFEVPRRIRERHPAHYARLRKELAGGRVTSMEALQRIEQVNKMSLADYRAAWGWVHFMLHGPPPAGLELRRFLQDLHHHRRAGPLAHRLRTRFPRSEDDLRRHIASQPDSSTNKKGKAYDE